MSNNGNVCMVEPNGNGLQSLNRRITSFNHHKKYSINYKSQHISDCEIKVLQFRFVNVGCGEKSQSNFQIEA